MEAAKVTGTPRGGKAHRNIPNSGGTNASAGRAFATPKELLVGKPPNPLRRARGGG